MITRRTVRGKDRARQANGFSGPSHDGPRTSPPDLRNETGFRPSLRDEISAALELVRGNQKAEAVAWAFGWSPATFYRRCEDPLSMEVREFLRLIELVPDPRFNARIRGHLSSIDARMAISEAEAGESYVRIGRFRDVAQKPLFGGGK